MIKYISLALLLFFLQGPEETNLTNHPADDRYATYSPDSKHILFESNRNGNWDLFIMNADGGQLEQITFGSDDERRPSWHPNGNQIVFESNESGEFQLYSLDIKSKEEKLISIPELIGQPIFASYSPDGSLLAFSERMNEDVGKLIVVDIEGKIQMKLMDESYRTFYPQWSPIGKQLLFFSRYETDNQSDEVYTIKLDGSDKSRLTNEPNHSFCPSWSPDGTRIAYVQSMEDNRPEIYVMNADGSGKKRITFNQDGETLPDWSPNGKKLLITAYRGGNYEIVTIILQDL